LIFIDLIIDGTTVRKATGLCHETMNRVVWDISEYKNKVAYIRIVDGGSGGWGHINVDDIKFF
jgi:levanase